VRAGAEGEVPNRVDTAIEAVQKARLHAPPNTVLGEAEAQELGDLDQAVLSSRQLADRAVDRV
jgi:hypothetical protein